VRKTRRAMAGIYKKDRVGRDKGSLETVEIEKGKN
jgi:hypothetical protein